MADESHDKKKHEGASHGGGAPHGGGHEEAHEGAPEWLISFADNTALMMGFFVILLALNMGPKGSASASNGQPTPEQLDWALSVRAGFNNPVNINSTEPRDSLLVKRLRERNKGDSQDPGVNGNNDKVQSIRPSDYHALSGAIQFDDGSTGLSAEARVTIRDLATKAQGLRLMVEIRGNASAAEAFNQNDRALQLSFDRALATAGELVKDGLDWKQMRIVSNGDNDRVNPVAYSKENQKPNQRVEIIVTNEIAPEDR